MNYLLTINKKVLVAISIIFILIIISFYFTKFYLIQFENINNIELKVVNADIIEPKFAINNINEKIYVTANEGNFIDSDNVLLKKNVKFKSKNFSIQTDNVTFNRKEQTASSNNNSLFISQKTTIYSEGFDIYDNGNKIKFYGNVKLILK